ncbi:hypothetical protein [Thalassovita mediterranea]|jgi:hypothetical protein|nr:hypothetical protein [Thalassovita mediterranea]
MSASERPTEIFIVGICPETQEAVSAFGMYSRQSFERTSDETEVEFNERINRYGRAKDILPEKSH